MVLREVLLGPVKPFTVDDLIAEAVQTPDPHGDALVQEVMARFPVEAPEPVVAAKQHAQLVALLEQHGVVIHWVEPADSRGVMSWSPTTTCSSARQAHPAGVG